MTGSELIEWFRGIWDDITNPAYADIPVLLVKLFVTGFGLIVVWTLGAWILRGLWETFSPLILWIWRVATAPARLPWHGVKALMSAYRKRQERKKQEKWVRRQEEQQRFEAEQERLRELSAAREREEISRHLGLRD
jgi:hypothetical protein